MDNEINEDRIFDIFPAILSFSIISILAITLWLIYFGIMNDYVYYPVQEIIINLSNSGMVAPTLPALTQTFGVSFAQVGSYIDPLWLICYLMFVGSTIYYCYRSRTESYFSTLGILFYGLMVVLFMLSIVVQIATWFNVNFTQKIIANVSSNLPIFSFWFQYMGVFFLIHILVCVLVMTIDFDLSNFFRRKNKEQGLDNEVL